MNNSIYYLDYIIKKNCFPNENYHLFFLFFHKNKDRQFFINASIFDKFEYLEYKVEFENKLKNNNFTKLEKACIGSMLGMAIGDSMGAKTEFLPLNYQYNKIKSMEDTHGGYFKLYPGQWTDDTSMGLCLADSLIEKRGQFDPKDIMIRFILWWFYGYNNSFRFDEQRSNKQSFGLGGNISGSFANFIKSKGAFDFTNFGDKNTSGNGTIMRNAAIPICYYSNLRIALRFAKFQSFITHQGYEAAGCCQLITFIVIKILNNKNDHALISQNTSGYINKNLKEILEDLSDFNCEYNSVNFLAHSQQEGNDKDRNWNWKSSDFKYSETRAKKQPSYIGSYCMDGLAMALHILYTTDSFESAILKSTNLCGDSDSVSSVVGQIAGAYYEMDGIPANWIKTLNKWDHNEIALRGYILYHMNEIITLSFNNDFYQKENKMNNIKNNMIEKHKIIGEKGMEKLFNGKKINNGHTNNEGCCYFF